MITIGDYVEGKDFRGKVKDIEIREDGSLNQVKVEMKAIYVASINTWVAFAFGPVVWVNPTSFQRGKQPSPGDISRMLHAARQEALQEYLEVNADIES